VKPSPLTTSLCFTGEQIADRTHLMCSFPELAFDVVFPAIAIPQKSHQLSAVSLQFFAFSSISPMLSLKADG
jgi:hypothetical protein